MWVVALLSSAEQVIHRESRGAWSAGWDRTLSPLVILVRPFHICHTLHLPQGSLRRSAV